jgi:hypothetical protein
MRKSSPTRSLWDRTSALSPPLIGTWQGDQGHDDSYVYTRGQAHAHFRERAIFTPAGPAHNGAQSLTRLDYRLEACRLEDVEPFHVEIGYWYWDAEHELVMRGLLTPRGIAVLAGGTAKPDDMIIKVTAGRSAPATEWVGGDQRVGISRSAARRSRIHEQRSCGTSIRLASHRQWAPTQHLHEAQRQLQSRARSNCEQLRSRRLNRGARVLARR